MLLPVYVALLEVHGECHTSSQESVWIWSASVVADFTAFSETL